MLTLVVFLVGGLPIGMFAPQKFGVEPVGFLEVILISLIIMLSTLLTCGLQVRRLNDLKLSGRFILVFFVVEGIVNIFGKQPGTPGEPAQYVAWALGLGGLNLLAWLAIVLWPSKAEANAYVVPGSYRSWWASLIGVETPTQRT
jgi:uncharacterized membrane protein YhaH (DUF805 family)